MNDYILGQWLNSQVIDVPLNHLIWLIDYKTYGTSSYVFNDKDILYELYRSPIAANDVQIYEEAELYNRENLEFPLYLDWYKNKYNRKLNDEEAYYYFRGFSNLSDEELSSCVEKHYSNKIDIKKCFSVGDSRIIHVHSMDAIGVGERHREQDIEIIIAGFEHDDLETPINGHKKAAISFAQKNCFMSEECEKNLEIGGVANNESGYMNSTNTNSGFWAGCARRTWCNNVLFNALEESVKKMIKPVKKLYHSDPGVSNIISTSIDKVFIPSQWELLGEKVKGYYSAIDGKQYDFYKSNSAKKYPRFYDAASGVTKPGAWYWTRSLWNSTMAFLLLEDDGGGVSNGYAGDSRFSITIMFCI